jgi:hypothetical protein
MLIDNLMGKNYLNYLNTITDTIPYLPCFNTSGEERVENNPWTFSFASVIYSGENDSRQGCSDYIFNILLRALDLQKQELLYLHRIRLGLVFRTPTIINHGEHLDFSQFKTGLFYINDSDGDTNIYEEKFNIKRVPEKFKLKKSISPIENRWYDFDGRRYHNSNSPTQNNYRLVLTFNYTIK